MGPLRGGLSLTLLPGAAWAEVCDKERPLLETGTQGTALSEALHLFTSPFGLALALLFLLALVIRKKWVLWICCALSSLTLLTLAVNPALPDPTGVRYFAVIEGCIGPQSLSFLFLGCMIAATALLARRT